VGSVGCFIRRFEEIYRAGLVDGNATRLLRKETATVIVKFEIVTIVNNGKNNIYRSQLLLSLKLRGSSIESLCIKIGGISGGVAGL
jgi:hypothetical protein